MFELLIIRSELILLISFLILNVGSFSEIGQKAFPAIISETMETKFLLNDHIILGLLLIHFVISS